jgi:hypothetical protein
LSDRILANPPYAKPGTRTRNADDGIYRNGGSQLRLELSPNGAGYAANFTIGLNL